MMNIGLKREYRRSKLINILVLMILQISHSPSGHSRRAVSFLPNKTSYQLAAYPTGQQITPFK
jgi:hypothetical protein